MLKTFWQIWRVSVIWAMTHTRTHLMENIHWWQKRLTLKRLHMCSPEKKKRNNNPSFLKLSCKHQNFVPNYTLMLKCTEILSPYFKKWWIWKSSHPMKCQYKRPSLKANRSQNSHQTEKKSRIIIFFYSYECTHQQNSCITSLLTLSLLLECKMFCVKNYIAGAKNTWVTFWWGEKKLLKNGYAMSQKHLVQHIHSKCWQKNWFAGNFHLQAPYEFFVSTPHSCKVR